MATRHLLSKRKCLPECRAQYQIAKIVSLSNTKQNTQNSQLWQQPVEPPLILSRHLLKNITALLGQVVHIVYSAAMLSKALTNLDNATQSQRPVETHTSSLRPLAMLSMRNEPFPMQCLDTNTTQYVHTKRIHPLAEPKRHPPKALQKKKHDQTIL